MAKMFYDKEIPRQQQHYQYEKEAKINHLHFCCISFFVHFKPHGYVSGVDMIRILLYQIKFGKEQIVAKV